MCGCIFRSLSTCARQQEYRRLACKNLNVRSTLRINLQEDTNRWFFLKFSWLFNFGTFLVLPCPPPMSVASDPFQSWHLSVKPPDSNIQDSNIYIFSKMSGSVQFGANGWYTLFQIQGYTIYIKEKSHAVEFQYHKIIWPPSIGLQCSYFVQSLVLQCILSCSFVNNCKNKLMQRSPVSSFQYDTLWSADHSFVMNWKVYQDSTVECRSKFCVGLRRGFLHLEHLHPTTTAVLLFSQKSQLLDLSQTNVF